MDGSSSTLPTPESTEIVKKVERNPYCVVIHTKWVLNENQIDSNDNNIENKVKERSYEKKFYSHNTDLEFKLPNFITNLSYTY